MKMSSKIFTLLTGGLLLSLTACQHDIDPDDLPTPPDVEKVGAQVVEEKGRAGKTKIVLYDFMRDILEYIKKGVVTCAIGQDPFRQGHDPVIYLYNYIVKRQTPPSDHMWTRIDVVDIDNVDNMLN